MGYNAGALDGNQSTGEASSTGAGGTTTTGPIVGETVEAGVADDNQVVLKGAATGNAPQVEVQGSDANIDLELVTKGTGDISIPTPQTATTATAGTEALPANPVGFLQIKLGGTIYKIPYYAV